MRRIIALCATPRSASAALEAIHGKTPFATDGDDLLENPAQVTQAFWETVGIPFIEDALSWEPGNGQSAYGRCEGGAPHANPAKPADLAPQETQACSPRKNSAPGAAHSSHDDAALPAHASAPCSSE